MKRGEIPISTILIILIAAISVFLFLSYFLANTDRIATHTYCNTLSKVHSSSYFPTLLREEPSICQKNEIKILKLTKKEVNQKTFYGNADTIKLNLSNQEAQIINLELPKEQIILGTLSLYVDNKVSENKFQIDKEVIDPLTGLTKTERQTVTEFNVENTGNSPLPTFYFEIPEGAEIEYATITIKGINRPLKADILFLMDSSNSMEGEWKSVCESKDLIKQRFQNLGMDTEFYVYALEKQPTATSCAEREITRAELAQNLPMGAQFMTYEERNNQYPGVNTECLSSIEQIAEPVANCYIDDLLSVKNGKIEEVSALCKDKIDVLQQLIAKYDECQKSLPGFDSYDEAWAVGIIWAANNDQIWRPDSKRFVFPISDSDPTGGSTKLMRPNLFRNDGAYSVTGTEQLAVDAAIAASKDKIVVNPVYGDEQALPGNRITDALMAGEEGYNVGSPYCRTKYPDTCGRILDWMQEVADQTNGQLISYKNTEELARSVENAVLSNYPTGAEFYLQGTTIWKTTEELDTPKTIDIKKELTKITASTTGSTTIPFTLTLGTVGAVTITNVTIIYKAPMHDIKLGTATETVTIGDLTMEESPKKVEIPLTSVNKETAACTIEPCKVPIYISSESNGIIKITDLNLFYKTCLITNMVTAQVISCWDEADYGKNNASRVCGEIAVPEECIGSTVTEKEITENLIRNKLCKTIENGEYGCGSKENLIVRDIELKHATNIMVLYNAKLQQIEVS